MARSPMTDDLKDEIIGLYNAGNKLADITRQTKVPRATIYYVLNREGIQPDRQRNVGGQVSAQALLDRIEEQARTIGKLEAAIAERDYRISQMDSKLTELTMKLRNAKKKPQAATWG